MALFHSFLWLSNILCYIRTTSSLSIEFLCVRHLGWDEQYMKKCKEKVKCGIQLDFRGERGHFWLWGVREASFMKRLWSLVILGITFSIVSLVLFILVVLGAALHLCPPSPIDCKFQEVRNHILFMPVHLLLAQLAPGGCPVNAGWGESIPVVLPSWLSFVHPVLFLPTPSIRKGTNPWQQLSFLDVWCSGHVSVAIPDDLSSKHACAQDYLKQYNLSDILYNVMSSWPTPPGYHEERIKLSQYCPPKGQKGDPCIYQCPSPNGWGLVHEISALLNFRGAQAWMPTSFPQACHTRSKRQEARSWDEQQSVQCWSKSMCSSYRSHGWHQRKDQKGAQTPSLLPCVYPQDCCPLGIQAHSQSCL